MKIKVSDDKKTITISGVETPELCKAIVEDVNCCYNIWMGFEI